MKGGHRDVVRIESHVAPSVRLKMSESAGALLSIQMHRPILDSDPAYRNGLADIERLGPVEWRLVIREGVKWSDGRPVHARDVANALADSARDVSTAWTSWAIASLRVASSRVLIVGTRLPTPWLAEILGSPFLAPRSKSAETGDYRLGSIDDRNVGLESRSGGARVVFVTTRSPTEGFDLFQRGALDVTDGIGVDAGLWSPTLDACFLPSRQTHYRYVIGGGIRVPLCFLETLAAQVARTFASELLSLGVEPGCLEPRNTCGGPTWPAGKRDAFDLDYTDFVPNRQVAELLVEAAAMQGVRVKLCRSPYSRRGELGPCALRLSIEAPPIPHEIGRYLATLPESGVAAEVWLNRDVDSHTAHEAERLCSHRSRRFAFGSIRSRYRSRVPGLVVPASTWFDVQGVLHAGTSA